MAPMSSRSCSNRYTRTTRLHPKMIWTTKPKRNLGGKIVFWGAACVLRDSSRQVHRKLGAFAWVTLVYNVTVILWGAYVRVTGSGAGCGNHWPLCNGEVIPRAQHIQTLIEFTHRVSSGIALLTVVGLWIWTRLAMPRKHPARYAGTAAVLLIINEALLGASLVLFQHVAQDKSIARAVSLSLHSANTMLLLAAIALTAFWTWKPSFIFASLVCTLRNQDWGIAADSAACRGNRCRNCPGRHAVPGGVASFFARPGLLVQQPLPLAVAHRASGHGAVSGNFPNVGSRGGVAVAEQGASVSCRDRWHRTHPATHAWCAQRCSAGADMASDGTSVRGGRSVDHPRAARSGVADHRGKLALWRPPAFALAVNALGLVSACGDCPSGVTLDRILHWTASRTE